MADTLWSGTTDDKLYRQSGMFDSSLTDSEYVGATDGTPYGVSFNGTDTVWSGNDDKFYLQSGCYTSTIKTSLSWRAIDGNVRGSAHARGDDSLITGQDYTKIWLADGQFSTTINDSENIGAIEVNIFGVSDDGTNTVWSGSDGSKVYLQSGCLTSTLKTSTSRTSVYGSGSTAGMDTLWVRDDVSASRLYYLAGQFGSTIYDSQSVSSVDTNPRMISDVSLDPGGHTTTYDKEYKADAIIAETAADKVYKSDAVVAESVDKPYYADAKVQEQNVDAPYQVDATIAALAQGCVAAVARSALAAGNLVYRTATKWVSLLKGDNDDRLVFRSGVPVWERVAGPSGALPAGSVVMWYSETIPAGYLACNGALYYNSEYPDLQAAIGYSFGGDLSTTFRVPDCRGLFVRGHANTSTRDPGRSTRTAQATGGASGDNVGSIQPDATAKPTTAINADTNSAHTHYTPYAYVASHSHSASGDGSHNHTGSSNFGTHTHSYNMYDGYSTYNSGTYPDFSGTQNIETATYSLDHGHSEAMSNDGSHSHTLINQDLSHNHGTSSYNDTHVHDLGGYDNETRPQNVNFQMMIKV